jgi:hypothetical protein
MGMSMHDRYYEPEDDNSGDFIDERTYELLKTEEYNPSLTHHLAEAIAESSEADQAIIIDFVNQQNWEALGRKLYFMSYDYMEKFAEAHAMDNYNSGLLHD